jgi:hypothetical protein
MTRGAAVPPSALEDALLDRALAETQRTRETVVATVAAVVNGCLLLLQSAQLLYFVTLAGAYALVPPALLVLGIALLALASKLYAQRVWAAIATAVLSGGAALGVGLWCVLLFLSGLLPLITQILPLALAIGAVMAAIAIAPCRRTATARKQAAAAGLDIDL